MAVSATPSPPAALNTVEFRLLAACACLMQHDWKTQRARVEAALAEQPDTGRFLELVKRHRLPILAEAVLTRTAQECGISIEAVAALKAGSRSSRLRNLMFHAELLRLQHLFAATDIALLPMKGTLLSQRLYGDMGLRQMKDIDLLVTPDKLQRALTLLEDNGYQIQLPAALRQGHAFRLVKKVWWHIECVHPATGIMVELHWRFEHIVTTALNELWWPWLSAEGPTRDRYELLYLCMHGAGHGWSRFKWLGDVCVLIDRMDVEQEWEPLTRLAGQLRLEPILAQTLLLLESLCGLQLPARLKDYTVQHQHYALPLVDTAFTYLTGPAQDLTVRTPGRILNVLGLMIRLDHRYTWHERIRHWLVFLAYRQSDIESMQLPGICCWLYPLIRPFSLVTRTLRHLLRRVAG